MLQGAVIGPATMWKLWAKSQYHKSKKNSQMEAIPTSNPLQSCDRYDQS